MAARNARNKGKTGSRTRAASKWRAASRGANSKSRSASGVVKRAARVVMGRSQPVRYAVVGLGHIAQAAVLPAFSHAKKNSKLVAFVSDDPEKHRKLGRKYDVEHHASYDEYDQLLASGEIDAVYIALPNTMHADFTVRAARHRVHVLCEKPMATTERDCQRMIDACDEHNVKLMIAYRLHFEEANLKAIEIAHSGKLGELRYFNSAFSMSVKPPNIRLEEEMGGGTLWDIGVYCINAARYIFRAEPIEVAAFSASRKGDSRFREVDEQTTAIMRFPGERLASFVCSFGASDVARYQIVGTKGDLVVEPAYEYTAPLKHKLTINGKTKEKTFSKRDQVAAELLYFSECVLKNRKPEPDGREGLVDVRIVRALYRSAETGRPVRLDEMETIRKRPTMEQEIKRRPVRKEPELVNVTAPHD